MCCYIDCNTGLPGIFFVAAPEVARYTQELASNGKPRTPIFLSNYNPGCRDRCNFVGVDAVSFRHDEGGRNRKGHRCRSYRNVLYSGCLADKPRKNGARLSGRRASGVCCVHLGSFIPSTPQPALAPNFAQGLDNTAKVISAGGRKQVCEVSRYLLPTKWLHTTFDGVAGWMSTEVISKIGVAVEPWLTRAQHHVTLSTRCLPSPKVDVFCCVLSTGYIFLQLIVRPFPPFCEMLC